MILGSLEAFEEAANDGNLDSSRQIFSEIQTRVLFKKIGSSRHGTPGTAAFTLLKTVFGSDLNSTVRGLESAYIDLDKRGGGKQWHAAINAP